MMAATKQKPRGTRVSRIIDYLSQNADREVSAQEVSEHLSDDYLAVSQAMSYVMKTLNRDTPGRISRPTAAVYRWNSVPRVNGTEPDGAEIVTLSVIKSLADGRTLAETTTGQLVVIRTVDV
jgi:hypothetical protein